ncbi:MAG: Rnase Y domain-containing protein [Acutalibacteraceae bacterium]
MEAKDEAFRLKSEADKEIKERRGADIPQERRMDQKEETLDKKTAQERREEEVKARAEQVEARLAEAEELKAQQAQKLETIAGSTAEDAEAAAADPPGR